jgi:hypothetical protein
MLLSSVDLEVPVEEKEKKILRDNEVARLMEILTKPQGGVNICGISGTGGVGKTFLMDHVMEELGLEKSGYMKLAVDGLSSNNLRGDFIGILDQKLVARPLHAPAKAGRDYFPHIRDLAVAHAKFMEEMEGEIAASTDLAPFKGIAAALLRGGQFLNRMVPKSKEYLDLSRLNISHEDLDKNFDHIVDSMQKMKILAFQEPTYLPQAVRDVLGITMQGRLRRDLHGLAADYLLADISRVIGEERNDDGGWRQHDFEFNKLLIVLDDFEVLGPTLGDYVFGALVPKLAAARFTSVIVVIGRDTFQSSNPDWHFKYKRFMRDQIRLFPFKKAEAIEYLATAGITGDEAEEVYKYTEGFPFLMSLVVEERGTLEDSETGAIGGVDVARQFYDRTVRWMTPQQAEWFSAVVYLDRVNVETLSWFFPNELVPSIQYWFEREASIRDPRAQVFKVKNILRTKVVPYLGTRDPGRHKKMLDTTKAHLQQNVQLESPLENGEIAQSAFQE